MRDESYDFWEDGFRHDTHPERGIEIWLHIAEVYNRHADDKSQHFRKELLHLITVCSTSDRERIPFVFERNYMPKAELDLVVADYFQGREG